MPRPTERQLLTSLDWQIEALKRLRDDLPELLRRAELDATDGFPSGSGGGSGSGQPSDPTARAAMAGASNDPKPADPVKVSVDRIRQNIEESAQIVRRLDGGRRLVHYVGESERGRKTSVEECACCPSPAISGKYCEACKKAWQRFQAKERERGSDDASPVVFQAQRALQLAQKQPAS
jgi:hypothetical protein